MLNITIFVKISVLKYAYFIILGLKWSFLV